MWDHGAWSQADTSTSAPALRDVRAWGHWPVDPPRVSGDARRRMRIGLTLALSIACVACAPPESPTTGEPFIAIERDFADFREWPWFDLPPSSLSMDHRSGTRRLYFNQIPEPGQPFPLATILVKTVEDGDPTTWEIHAMVKRGGGFNEAGARGWEFFDLAIDPAGSPTILWRGEGPPPGAEYPGEGTGDGLCNGCHGLVADRDFVFDRDLFP